MLSGAVPTRRSRTGGNPACAGSAALRLPPPTRTLALPQFPDAAHLVRFPRQSCQARQERPLRPPDGLTWIGELWQGPQLPRRRGAPHVPSVPFSWYRRRFASGRNRLRFPNTHSGAADCADLVSDRYSNADAGTCADLYSHGGSDSGGYLDSCADCRPYCDGDCRAYPDTSTYRYPYSYANPCTGAYPAPACRGRGCPRLSARHRMLGAVPVWHGAQVSGDAFSAVLGRPRPASLHPGGSA